MCKYLVPYTERHFELCSSLCTTLPSTACAYYLGDSSPLHTHTHTCTRTHSNGFLDVSRERTLSESTLASVKVSSFCQVTTNTNFLKVLVCLERLLICLSQILVSFWHQSFGGVLHSRRSAGNFGRVRFAETERNSETKCHGLASDSWKLNTISPIYPSNPSQK